MLTSTQDPTAAWSANRYPPISFDTPPPTDGIPAIFCPRFVVFCLAPRSFLQAFASIKISKKDDFARALEFRVWLRQKNMFFRDLNRDEREELFDQFVVDWNRCIFLPDPPREVVAAAPKPPYQHSYRSTSSVPKVKVPVITRTLNRFRCVGLRRTKLIRFFSACMHKRPETKQSGRERPHFSSF